MLPPKVEQVINEALNKDFPLWVKSKDQILVKYMNEDIKVNVMVAQDGLHLYG